MSLEIGQKSKKRTGFFSKPRETLSGSQGSERRVGLYAPDQTHAYRPARILADKPETIGANGAAVKLNTALKAQEKARFKENQFNVVASELIPVNRTVRDVRPTEWVFAGK